MQYTSSEAARKLARLLTKACAGEEVVIAFKQLRVKLIPIRALKAVNQERIPGRLKGRIFGAPDAFTPLTDQELLKLGFK